MALTLSINANRGRQRGCCAALPVLRRKDDRRRDIRRPAPRAVFIAEPDQNRHLMTVAAHPASQRRSPSLPAARRSGTAMSSQASADPLHPSSPACASRLRDRTSSSSSFRSTRSPPCRSRTDAGAPSATLVRLVVPLHAARLDGRKLLVLGAVCVEPAWRKTEGVPGAIRFASHWPSRSPMSRLIGSNETTPSVEN